MIEYAKRWVKESKYVRQIRRIHFDYRVWFREPGTLPTFLIIGAQRSGTTFLHNKIISETSAMCSPLQKEVHFFDNKYYRGKRWYERFFDRISDSRGEVKNFETSPYYLYHPAVPKRAAEILPEARLIVVLRDPVERAISHYKWMRQAGVESRPAVEAFRFDAERFTLERDPEYLQKFEDPFYFDYEHIHTSYLRRSLYHIQLRRWLKWFDPAQIRVMSSAKLFEQSGRMVRKLATFLGLDYRGRSDAKMNQNASSQNDGQVSDDARALAEQCLDGEVRKLREVVTDEMILAGSMLNIG